MAVRLGGRGDAGEHPRVKTTHPAMHLNRRLLHHGVRCVQSFQLEFTDRFAQPDRPQNRAARATHPA